MSERKIERVLKEDLDVNSHVLLNQKLTLTMRIPTIALGSDEAWMVFRAPRALELITAYVVVDDAVTGANTNYFSLIVYKVSDGTTNAIVTKAYTLGNDISQYYADDLGTLSATHKILAAGDRIQFVKAETGSGMASPALALVIEYKYV